MTILGLALVALGSGGIKPCVAAFGGDQFKMPEQAAQMATFFSIFYFAINSGSLISTTITPILRADVHCFGDNDCFSLAFGVPGMLMIVSIGKPDYIYVLFYLCDRETQAISENNFVNGHAVILASIIREVVMTFCIELRYFRSRHCCSKDHRRYADVLWSLDFY